MRVEKEVEAVFEPYAECLEEGCHWDQTKGATTQDRVKQHVRDTKHRVRMVVEKVSIWGPSE